MELQDQSVIFFYSFLAQAGNQTEGEGLYFVPYETGFKLDQPLFVEMADVDIVGLSLRELKSSCNSSGSSQAAAQELTLASVLVCMCA